MRASAASASQRADRPRGAHYGRPRSLEQIATRLVQCHCEERVARRSNLDRTSVGGARLLRSARNDSYSSPFDLVEPVLATRNFTALSVAVPAHALPPPHNTTPRQCLLA